MNNPLVFDNSAPLTVGSVMANRFQNQSKTSNLENIRQAFQSKQHQQYGNPEPMTVEQQRPINQPPPLEIKGDFKDYITRAFQKCRNKTERNVVENALKKVMSQATSAGDVHTRNWALTPLPTLPREKMGFSSVSNIGTQNINNTSGNTNYSHMFSLDKGTNIQNMQHSNNNGNDYEKANILHNINKSGPNLDKLLNKRSFAKMNEGKFQIGVNAHGKKVIKTNKAQAIVVTSPDLTKEEEEKRNTRKGRFHRELTTEVPTKVFTTPSFSKNQQQNFDGSDENDLDFDEMAEKWRVIGTNTNLEKPYLRLTTEPDPATIRPEPVLKKTLKMLTDKWKEGKAEYNYIADQFRSMRQDMSVQHIKNSFTVKAYECNARISMECHDVTYFNLCQSKLHELYKHGIESKNITEFLSYRFIYLVFGNQKGQLNRLLQELTTEQLDSENMRFAMALRDAYEMGNVKKLFQLYKSGITMTQYLIDLFVSKLRIWGLQIICKSHGEKLSISYLTEILAFHDETQFLKFIEESEGILSEDKKHLLLKESFKVYVAHPWLKKRILCL
jgi:stalled ribosome alternative rescue factor ArfA